MTLSISSILLIWYAEQARDLPWRNLGGSHDTSDPYAIWVSEIMLQQTRVESVMPYYERWMRHFPTVEALAQASLRDVLNLWEGLGYYSRARNLHKAAQIVLEEYGGQLPADPKALRSLPGIGPYTAGAIASIAFGLDQPALDGNIRRVYARLFDVTEAARSPQGEHRLWELAAQHLPPGQAGEYNQALMDLGATICTPRNPDCVRCPLADQCLALARGVQAERPVKLPKAKVPHITVTAAVIRRDGQFLLAQRPQDGLLGGMWEFPGGKQQEGEDLPTCLKREICEELDAEVKVGEEIGVYRHTYTHFKVTLHAFECSLNGDEPRPLEVTAIHWVTPNQFRYYPMGKIDRMIATDILLRDESNVVTLQSR